MTVVTIDETNAVPTVVTSGNFAADMRHQCAILQHMANSVHEHGFCISVGGCNKWADKPQFLFGFLAGGFGQMLKQWGDNRGMTPVVIYVGPGDRQNIERYSDAFHGKMAFAVTIEKLAKLRPLALSFELASVKTHGIVTGFDKLTWTEDSNSITIRGNCRMHLQTVVNILMFPQHKKTLTSPVRKPKKRKGK